MIRQLMGGKKTLIVFLFDYKSNNLTKEQQKAIEDIGDIVHQAKYDVEVKIDE